MYLLSGSIAVLTLFTNVKSDEAKPTPLPVRAKVSVSQGEARLFSGENVQLTCSIPDQPETKWKYHWFRNDQPLGTGDVYSMQKAAVQQGGKYTCSGEKEIDTWPYSLLSLPSEPLTVYVDGGWALLRIPAEPLLIEETMTLTCRVRDDPILVEVVFYKDGVEIQKRNDKDLVFPELALKDQGTYSCRATWVQRFDYHAAQSLPIYVPVLDKLDTPVLEIQPDNTVDIGQKVVLRCVTHLNVKTQNLSILYYFMKDGTKLGPASSYNMFNILKVDQDDAGFYTCKARVRALNIERSSSKVELKVEE